MYVSLVTQRWEEGKQKYLLYIFLAFEYLWVENEEEKHLIYGLP